MSIHSTAIIEPGATVGKDVEIGPYCVVGPNVVLGDRVKLVSHVTVSGHTTIGEDTIVYPFACLGHAPQDLKYAGEASTLKIGARNRIREHVTMHPGTAGDKMSTVVGDNNLFMVGVHVAHDCVVGNNVILANNATLAGHVHVGDYVIVGGLSAVLQFTHIGAHAIIGGMSGVENDVIPFGLVKGERATLAGLNYVGMERRGFDKDSVRALTKAYKQLFEGQGTLAERLETVAQDYAANDVVMRVVDFIRAKDDRSLCQPRIAATG